jgi:Right handed beta helix region
MTLRIQAHILWLAAVLSLVALSSRPTLAATILVARDGTGDYTVLFDAVAAAASGDTIRISPGEYPETPSFTFPGGVFQVSAAVTVSDLTIIGDSPDSVFIGPSGPTPADQNSPSGISATLGASFRVVGVTLRNLASGLDAEGDSVSASRSRFVNCYNGIFASVTGTVEVDSCQFVGCTDSGIWVSPTGGGASAEISRSTFLNCVFGITLQVPLPSVSSCIFDGGVVGVQLSFGAHGIIRDCQFLNQESNGCEIGQGSHGELYDNTLAAGMLHNIQNAGLLTGMGNVLMGGSRATIWTFYISDAAFQGNHILNAGGATILVEGGTDPTKIRDYSLNYWGTTDGDQISQWIIDRADDPVHNFVDVVFRPIAIVPIPNQTQSAGSLKALFADPK